MPYLRWLTLKSFCKFNPDYEVKLYIPEERNEDICWKTEEQENIFIGKDYFSYVKELPVEVLTVSFEENLNEIHKSDILRWNLLSTYGGVWADMDILFLKSLELPEADVGVCIHPKHLHLIPVVFSSEKNKFFNYIYKKALTKIGNTTYQGYGAELFNDEFVTVESIVERFSEYKVFNIPVNDFFYYPNSGSFFNSTEKLNTSLVGIHWWGGQKNAFKFINELTHANYHTYGGLLREVLTLINGEK